MSATGVGRGEAEGGNQLECRPSGCGGCGIGCIYGVLEVVCRGAWEARCGGGVDDISCGEDDVITVFCLWISGTCGVVKLTLKLIEAGRVATPHDSISSR